MARSGPEIDAALEQAFRRHLPPGEERTYLLVDSREPEANKTLAELIAVLGTKLGATAFAAQPIIVGTFVMPIGDPTVLLADRIDDGVHIGRYQTEDGEEAELPIGEVRTPGGRVFRLGE